MKNTDRKIMNFEKTVLVGKNSSFNDVKKACKKCYGFIKDKSLEYWSHDYLLCEVKLSRLYSEEELERKLNIFFCNGLNHSINKIQLVYSAYEGILSILPVDNNDKYHHDSYFNPNYIDHINDDPKDYEKAIFNIWGSIIKQDTKS